MTELKEMEHTEERVNIQKMDLDESKQQNPSEKSK
jgi:hypothetical protein